MGRLIKYQRLVLLSCIAATLVTGGLLYTFGIFFKPLAAEFGWGRGQLSLVSTAFLLAYAPGAVVLGRIADRYEPRGVMGLAAICVGLGLFLCSRASAWGAFVVYYALVGFGTGATVGIPVATVQRWFVKSRGLMVGVVLAGVGLGSLAFSLLAAFMVSSWGWRQGFVYLSAITGLLLAISAAFMFHSPAKLGLVPSPLPDGGIARGNTATALRSAKFWAVVSLYVLSLVPSMFLLVHLVPYATDRGVAALVAAGALGMLGAFRAPGQLLLGHMADRLGWLRSLALTNFLAALTLLGLPLVNSPWTLYLFVLVYGFLYGGLFTQLMGTVGHFFGTASLGELLGYALGAGVVAGAFSPWLAGFIFDTTGSYLTVMLLGSVSHVMAGIWSLRLR